MTVTHVGSTKKYSEGWQDIFSGKKVAKAKAAKAAQKKKAPAKKKAKR